MLTEMRIPFTVDSSGDAVVYGESTVFARLIALFYDRGDMDTLTDLTLTTDRNAVVETLFLATDVGTNDKIWYPRRVVQNNAGGNLAGTVGGDREPYQIIGRPKLTVADGGDEKSGALHLILET